MSYSVSVIVPVYRVEDKIQRCLDSLLAQDMATLPSGERLLEVLLVDDRGGDQSMALCEHYIATHHLESDWHILTMPANGGPAAARNLGIGQAKGEYIAFCDADDWVEPNMYETLYHQARQYDADLSSAAAVLDYPDGSHRRMTNPEVAQGELTVANRKHILKHFISNFTTMLFRREWLLENGLRFPDSRSGEDSCFMGCCYLLCRRIAQCNEPFYHYVIYPTSISHSKHVYRGRQKREAFRQLLLFAKDHGLWPQYKWVLRWVYFKKAIITSILDYLKSL